MIVIKKVSQFESGYQGEGWYSFNPWDSSRDQFMSPQAPEAVWVEFESQFEEYSEYTGYTEDVEMVVEYYGNGDQPDDPDVKVSPYYQ